MAIPKNPYATNSMKLPQPFQKEKQHLATATKAILLLADQKHLPLTAIISKQKLKLKKIKNLAGLSENPEAKCLEVVFLKNIYMATLGKILIYRPGNYQHKNELGKVSYTMRPKTANPSYFLYF